VWLLEYLKREGARKLFGYDPVIGSGELSSLELKACELEDGFNNADLVIFMNNHKSYSNLNINMLLATMNKPSILYDGWNIFQPKEIKNNPGIMYAATGVG
jgi:UDP-N-acetyl-D-mannosaminuronic acid dehydrogenase